MVQGNFIYLADKIVRNWEPTVVVVVVAAVAAAVAFVEPPLFGVAVIPIAAVAAVAAITGPDLATANDIQRTKALKTVQLHTVHGHHADCAVIASTTQNFNQVDTQRLTVVKVNNIKIGDFENKLFILSGRHCAICRPKCQQRLVLVNDRSKVHDNLLVGSDGVTLSASRVGDHRDHFNSNASSVEGLNSCGDSY